MRGVITRKEVLVHSLTIVRLFGLRAFSRCLRAAFSARPTTFLETVSVPVVVRSAASPHAPPRCASSSATARSEAAP